MLNTAAGRANDSLTGVITDSYVQVMVRSVAWPTLAWMFVIAVVSFAGGGVDSEVARAGRAARGATACSRRGGAVVIWSLVREPLHAGVER